MTLSSLCELNRSLRQQAVDLVLSIVAMKESASLLAGSTSARDESCKPSGRRKWICVPFAELRAGPAKGRTRTLRGD
jgi:hypothetical protein